MLTVPTELRELLEINEGDIVEFDLLAVVRRKPATANAQPQSQPEPTGVKA